MKHPFLFCFITLLIVLISSPFLQAQKLTGMTFGGGSFGGGTVYRINADGNQFTPLINFKGYPEIPRIICGNDFILYGTTSQGGANGVGTIFKMNPDGTNYQTIFDFDLSMGTPQGNLTQGSDGRLYGSTSNINIAPTIFGINTDGSKFAKLGSFTVSDNFISPLCEGSDGKLYGMTGTWSPGHYGSIISINKDGTGYKIIYNFGQLDGPATPAPLIQDGNGNLYGIAQGGTYNRGIIFKIQTNGTGFTKLIEFDGTNGQNPRNQLILGADGNLYGNTTDGVIFTLKTDGQGFNKIYSIPTGDGFFYNQPLIQNSDDQFLYGNTANGGANHAGIIFKIKTDGTQYQKIYDFEIQSTPGYVGYIALGNNKVFGTNVFGGLNGAGNIFSIHPDGSSYTDLYDLGGPSGFSPNGNLIQGQDSLLYGTTSSGGNQNVGTIFVTNGNGVNYKKLFDFWGINGASPYGGPTQTKGGSVYVTAAAGGSQGTGTIIKINPDGTGFTKVFDFNDYTNTGVNPYAPLLEGLDGNLYGTTFAGGHLGFGIIFSIKPDGSEFTKIFENYDFSYSALIQDHNAVLYGSISSGGANNKGYVFSINPNGTSYTMLRSFNGQDGEQPSGSLILGKDGVLYGMTTRGGNSNYGICYSVQTDGSNFKKLMDFQNDINGGSPVGALIQLENGYLYGRTTGGGAHGNGVLFVIHTDGTGFRKIFDYPASNQGGPFLQTSLINLNLRKQSIHFNPIQEVTQGDPSFTLSASSSTGLPVTFSSNNSALASVNGSTVTILNPGKETIVATQFGDGIYDAATAAQQSFCIDPLAPTISISGGGTSLALNSSDASGNQWFYNNSIITGATNQTLQLSAPGNYTVKVNVDNCYSLLSDAFVVTEVIDQSQREKFSVYPNPSKNSINLNLESFQQGEHVEVVIFNTLGQPMEYLALEGGKTSTIDVSKYPNGNFIITLAQAEKIYHSQFIKY